VDQAADLAADGLLPLGQGADEGVDAWVGGVCHGRSTLAGGRGSHRCAGRTAASGIGFQLAPDFQPPQWPDPGRPQQMHFDVMVDDIDAAEPRVLALGARRLAGGDGGSRVYADPAGHPFCLIPRPGWAAPIGTPGQT
jgi:Glyoxalase-like domain